MTRATLINDTHTYTRTRTRTRGKTFSAFIIDSSVGNWVCTFGAASLRLPVVGFVSFLLSCSALCSQRLGGGGETGAERGTYVTYPRTLTKRVTRSLSRYPPVGSPRAFLYRRKLRVADGHQRGILRGFSQPLFCSVPDVRGLPSSPPAVPRSLTVHYYDGNYGAIIRINRTTRTVINLNVSCLRPKGGIGTDSFFFFFSFFLFAPVAAASRLRSKRDSIDPAALPVSRSSFLVALALNSSR